jgi:hypothetical protein
MSLARVQVFGSIRDNWCDAAADILARATPAALTLDVRSSYQILALVSLNHSIGCSFACFARGA